jgi:hypothetical protein
MSGMVEKVAEVVLAVENQDEVVALFEDLFGLEFDAKWTVPADVHPVKLDFLGPPIC